jgi:CGNR zinc finger
MKKHTLRDKLDMLRSLLDFGYLPAEKLAAQGGKVESLLQRAIAAGGPAGLPWRQHIAKPYVPVDERGRVHGRDGVAFTVAGPHNQERRLQQLQRRLLMMLNNLSAPASPRASRASALEQLQGDIYAVPHFKIAIEAVDDGGGLRLCATAVAMDRVLYRAFALVEQVGRHRIRTCAADGCHKLFVNTGNKEFCSSRCSQRVYMRAYRNNNFTPPPQRGGRKGAAHDKSTRTRRR